MLLKVILHLLNLYSTADPCYVPFMSGATHYLSIQKVFLHGKGLK
jgi:hypothetical protein